MSFSEQVAMIQGGTMGRAIGLALAAEGATIAVCDLDGAAAHALANEIEQGGGRACAGQVDTSDLVQVTGFVQMILDRFRRLDLLVNNAGWNYQQPFLENTPELWERVLNVNLRGPIHCCRAALEAMVPKQRGKIVNIASDAGRVGSTGDVVYSAAKAGVIGLTKALAREAAAHGITVNCVCPGPTETPLLWTAREKNPRLVEALVRSIPLRRAAQPTDIAHAVLFLASDHADYVTGQTLSVSGGMTMV